MEESRRPALARVSPRLLAIVLASALLALSFVRQLQLLDGPFSSSALLFLLALGLPIGLLLGLVDPQPREEWPQTGALPAVPRRAYALATAALLCAALAGWEVQEGGSPTVATVAWVAGMIAALAASLPSRLRLPRPPRPSVGWPLPVLLAILLVATALRVTDLATIPGFIHFDEANDGLQARAIRLGQVPSIFAISIWSQLPMLIHAWYASFQWMYGDSLTSQRLGSVVLGLLSILVVALLGKELFGWRAGLLAAALLAVAHFHIHFSRVGIQVISGDLAVPLTFYLLVRTLRYLSPLAAVGSGILLTADLHAYFGSRICFVVVPLWVIALLVTGYRARLSQIITLAAWILLGLLVSITPIGVYILHNWGLFTQHTTHETVFDRDPDIRGQLFSGFGTYDLGYILRTEFWRTIETIFYTGDSGLQYGMTHPLLDPISAAMLPGSVVFAAVRIRHQGSSLLLITLMAVLVIGGAMTINMPYWPRLIVLAPILALLLASFLDALWRAWERLPRLRIPAAVATVALVGGIAYGNYHWYFDDYAPAIHRAFIAAPMDVGNYLRADKTHAYAYGLSAGNVYINDEVIRFLAPSANTCTLINSLDLSQCQKPSLTNALFFIFPGSEQLIPSLQKRFPGGTLSKLRTYDLGQSIWIYRIHR